MQMSSLLMLVATLAAAPFAQGRALPTARSSAPTVDLGYAAYQGYHDDTYGLNVWKSVRYAAPPVGSLRWQAPQPPTGNGSLVSAVDQPPLCPQTGGYGLPEVYGFGSALGDEDCLFLNVYAAPNASDLPVFVWIHGGGYGVFGAVYDPSVLINTNGNGFITVEIQYRLGAFGFLASEDVKAHGQLNAGLLDQRRALQWVQEHISKFGGDPSRVTIGGESAGAGSVMFHALGHGGKQTDLFSNVISASPYSYAIHDYRDPVPTKYYSEFASLAGCGQNNSRLQQYPSVFQCLVETESEVLQYASGNVSESFGTYGSWAFLPVIDQDYIKERPSVQLSKGLVAGRRILVGNNANEGVPLTNPKVKTRAEYDSFVSSSFPLFSPSDIDQLNDIYQINNSAPGDSDIRYDTLGTEGPTALTQSGLATGIQQTAFNILAETNFVCPAQWLAEAFSQADLQAWKYQFSVTPGFHGSDLTAYFAVDATTPNADFRRAFQKVWGNFIVRDDPTITLDEATAGYANATAPAGTDGNINWPRYTAQQPYMMDLNTTGGDLTQVVVTTDLSYYLRVGAGIANNFRLVDALSWEGGRGARCDFWSGVSARVPQ
ncbi:hypothetical protein INS49_005106 [Diaporthe citri]|uniref:uncharacterized protein n=1 Tax=Diaporthe citri TaxID=83186 RepID=UPI001C81D47F|nr:uncharacterized protein INS49_005106 [Diaporthe citri]KAG6353849.1 hypothetical protein INS49_005106 [Diaporthe citri]